MARRYALVPEFQGQDVISLLPKHLQGKGKLVLEHLHNLNVEDGRIIYSDGSKGSYLADLLKYYLDSAKQERPSDAVQFRLLLLDHNVPEQLLARPLVLKRSTEKNKKKNESVKWRHY